MKIIDKIKNLIKRKNSVKNHLTYQNSTSKYSLTPECSVELSTITNQKKNEINANLKSIVKKYIDNPQKLIQYMKLKEIKIYEIENAEKILSYIGEEEGFIMPLKGAKAIILNIILLFLAKSKIKKIISTEAMLIFEKTNTEVYTIARAMHKYYGYKNNLPGFDEKSQEIFKKVYANKKQTEIDKMPLKDVLACREAIARDLDSINFTIQLSREHEQSKKILESIIQDKKTHI